MPTSGFELKPRGGTYHNIDQHVGRKQRRTATRRQDQAAYNRHARNRRLCLPFGSKARATDDFRLHWHVSPSYAQTNETHTIYTQEYTLTGWSQDKVIIATAIPQITDEFHSANDIGWYGTAYLLTNCAFLLVFEKLYTFLNVKATFLSAIILFEVGSTICGAAPNSIAFIIGRAIAGLGAGGVQSGVVCVTSSSLHSLFSAPCSQYDV